MAEDDDIEWSDSTTTLRDIADAVSFPCVVRVCEGYESGDEITSFSLGDLIKIDSCEIVKKIRGRFVEWLTGETSGRFSKIAGEDISIPVSYKACVRVLPKHGVYHVYSAMEDVINDFPRRVEVMDQIIAIAQNGDAVAIQKGDVLETVGWRKPKDTRQTSYLKCKHNETQTLQIPSTTRGRFRVLRDDMEYTLQEVIQRFPLPQIVQFTDQISKEKISSDIKEAIDNLDNFEGKIMLDKVYSEQILFGHYKSLHSDPAANKFLKRTAIMIPLTNPDLEEVTVQYPLYMDSQDYEVFVIKNFSDTKAGRQVLDRALYMEFTKKSPMRFAEVDDSASSENTDEHPPQPPPRPPRGASSKIAPVRPFVSASTKRPVEEVKLPLPSKPGKGSLGRQEAKSPLSSKTSTESLSRQESFSIFSEQGAIGGILSDIDWASSGDSSKLTDDMKLKKASEGHGIKAKVKGLFKKSKAQDRPSRPTTPETESVYEISDEEEDAEYDYPDLAKEPNMGPKRRGYLTVVKDIMKISKSSKAPLKSFSELSVEELEERLRMCSMDTLAQICHKESYDGKIFSKLSDADLQNKPFNLSSLDIFKLNNMKEGWTPTFSKDS